MGNLKQTVYSSPAWVTGRRIKIALQFSTLLLAVLLIPVLSLSQASPPSNVHARDQQATGLRGTKDAPSVTQQSASSPSAQDTPGDIKTWPTRHFGWLVGGVVFALLLLIAAASWDLLKRSISGFPQRFYEKLRSPARLPKADPKIFTVAVAHLNNDSDGQGERLIVEALREIKGFRVTDFDRVIPDGGPEQVDAGHEAAREFLKQSGADILVWGTLLVAGSKFATKLHFTPSKSLDTLKEAASYQLTEDLNLAPVSRNDLVNVLRLSIASHAAEPGTQRGQFIVSQLGPFIDKVRQLLAASQTQEGWTVDARAGLRFIFAYADGASGQQSESGESLEEAVVAYREVLKERTRERVPLDWAMTQNNLGGALTRLGERESGTARLEEAVVALREALKELTRERVPLDWAMTQNNLGAALASLGERESGTVRLEEATAAYHEALKERNRERAPLDWATTQNNLGRALRALGGQKRDVNLIFEALKSHMAAWRVSSPEASAHASTAATNARLAVDALKGGFEPPSYEEFLAEHADILKRMGVLS